MIIISSSLKIQVQTENVGNYGFMKKNFLQVDVSVHMNTLIDMCSHKITRLADCTDDADAANKKYVDSKLARSQGPKGDKGDKGDKVDQ